MSFKVPLFDLNYGQEEEAAVIRTLASKWISMGQNVKELENAFEQHLGISHAVAMTNCTAALHVALKTMGISESDEVIIPSLTFVATVNAVKYVGAIPVFADITSYDDFSLCPEDVARKITSRTKAIIVMHYAGFSCDMDAIMEVARAHDLKVLEDAAHAPGSEHKNRKLGTIGDIGCFSFFSNKNIACAEGGMLVTAHEEYAEGARLLRSHGMTTLSYERSRGHAAGYDVLSLGYNYRMDDIRAALALVQLGKLEEDRRRRAELRALYVNRLGDLKELAIPYRDYPFICFGRL